MIQKLGIGILTGAIIGLFITSFFLGPETPIKELFWTKITATSMITGLFCGIYGYFSRSKFQVFIISILIGITVFYAKYWITGHHFDPGIMGAFTGALIGGVLAVVRKLTHSYRVYQRLETLKKKGFNNYG